MRVLSSTTTGQDFVMVCADDADDLPRRITIKPGNTVAILLVPDPILKYVEFDTSNIRDHSQVLNIEHLTAYSPQAGLGLLCTGVNAGEVEITAEFKQPLSQFAWKRTVLLIIEVV